MRKFSKNIIAAVFTLTSIIYSSNENITLNPDSITFVELFKQIKDTIKFETEIQTARSLADLNFYSEASEIINSLILSKTKPLKSIVPQAYKESNKVILNIELFNYYNNIGTVNKKILNSAQKDSIDLLKRQQLILGTTIDLGIKPRKFGLKKIIPNITFTNITIMPGIKLQGQWLDEIITITENLNYELYLAKYQPDTTFITDDSDTAIVIDTFINEVYNFNGFENDSNDVLANTFGIEFSNFSKNYPFKISFPFKWVLLNFRENQPILFSKSAYSVNPYLEYQFQKLEGSVSGSFYTEYSDYFGKGQPLQTDTTNDYNDNVLDKILFTPELSFLYYNKIFNTELTGSLRLENYPKRGEIIKKIGEEKIFLQRIYNEICKSNWYEASLKTDIKLSELLSLKTSLELQKTTEKNSALIINGISSIDSTLKLEGSSIKVYPKLCIKSSKFFKGEVLYTFEHRDAPVYDSIQLTILNKYSGFLWEKYNAHEPQLTIIFESPRLFWKVSGAYRIENVDKNPAYEIDLNNPNTWGSRRDSNTWKFKWYFHCKITNKIALSLNGLYDSRFWKIEEISDSYRGKNFSFNSSLTFNIK